MLKAPAGRTQWYDKTSSISWTIHSVVMHIIIDFKWSQTLSAKIEKNILKPREYSVYFCKRFKIKINPVGK